MALGFEKMAPGSLQTVFRDRSPPMKKFNTVSSLFSFLSFSFFSFLLLDPEICTLPLLRVLEENKKIQLTCLSLLFLFLVLADHERYSWD